MDRFSGRRALVTGAGSGIGRATAEALADRGADLVICDVNPERVAEAAEALRAKGVAVSAHTLDVSDRAAFEAFAEAVHADGPVDILVNNAGVGVGGRLLETPLEDWDWVMGVNLWGVIYGCHYFVPKMVEAGRGGHVINIASAAGLTGVPSLGAYSVTKCAVVAYSEALLVELEASGVGVSVICPGFLATRILADGRIRGAMNNPAGLSLVERVMNAPGRRPEAVAKAIVAAVEKRRFMVTLFSEARLLLVMRRLSPWALTHSKRRLLRRAVSD